MFASATSGDRHNNNKFSHCSKSNISAVLDAITDGRKPNCFTESNGAFCGNKIVEEGEECDCGFDDNECAEQCCYPRKSVDLSEEENKLNRCEVCNIFIFSNFIRLRTELDNYKLVLVAFRKE